VILARVFLGEVLTTAQYVGVVAVIAGCLALAYMPHESRTRKTQRRWMAYAGAAVVIWGVSATLIRFAYRFPGAHEANMALFLGVGGLLTLGVYGLLFGRQGAGHEWGRSFGPMATMAIGSLLAAIAYKKGPASIVTPLSGAYPVVTLGFAWALLHERPSALQWAGIVCVLAGMVLTSVTG
jgi:drug/metabolite transporter (DMT)-like permease